MEQNNNITHKKYHITLLTNLFVGFLGIHRIINKKYITGFIMLGFGSLSIILWILALIFSSGLLYGMALTIFIILNILKFIDMIFIFINRFKDKHGNNIASNKPFFKVWSNIATISILVFSLLLLSIIGIVSAVVGISTNNDISDELKQCFESDPYNNNDDEDEDDYKSTKFDDYNDVDKYITKKGFESNSVSTPSGTEYIKKIDDEIYLSIYMDHYPDASSICRFYIEYFPEDGEEYYWVRKDYEDGSYYGNISYGAGDYKYVTIDSDGDVSTRGYYDEDDDYVTDDEEDALEELADILDIEYNNLLK